VKALVIDDEPGIRLALSHFLKSRGYEVYEASTGSDGLLSARRTMPDLILLDQNLPDMPGDSLLPLLVSEEQEPCVMVITGHAEVDHAVRTMRLGAEYLFPKPVDLHQLALILDGLEARIRRKFELAHHRELSEQSPDPAGIIGLSPQIIGVQRLISLLSKNVATPVLVLGESGTGKEMVARAIHERSGVKGPLVEINSASLSESLLESELFGHEKGAFTDAAKSKRGLFELADCGTIFFDELAEMPLVIQAKLLKVLDTGLFRRVGGLEDLRSSARFIGATNRDMSELVRKGLFREDLYYRINVLPISLSPLRERGGDVRLLADHYVDKLSREMGKTGIKASTEFMDALQAYSWPGNVRELKNVIERAIIIADGLNLTEHHLPGELGTIGKRSGSFLDTKAFPTLRAVEDDHIRQALQFTNNNLSKAATLLGISRSTLHEKLKRLK